MKKFKEFGLEGEGEGTDVFLNGIFIGGVDDPNEFVSKIKEKRRVLIYV